MAHLILRTGQMALGIPAEISSCFENESSKASNKFAQLSENQQKAYLDWIFAARTDETKVQRIIKLIENLEQNIHLHEKNKGYTY